MMLITNMPTYLKIYALKSKYFHFQNLKNIERSCLPFFIVACYHTYTKRFFLVVPIDIEPLRCIDTKFPSKLFTLGEGKFSFGVVNNVAQENILLYNACNSRHFDITKQPLLG